MAIKFGNSLTTPATKTPPPAAPPQAPAARQSVNPNRGDDGFAAPSPGEGGGGGTGKKWDEFTTLTAGKYTFNACVGAISTLTTKTGTRGTIVEWKVLGGDEAGRPIGWNQTPPPESSDARKAFWRGQIIKAFSAGGWTWDENAETGWPGWPKVCDRDGNPCKDANGKDIKATPWDTFFVEHCADGIYVPVCFEIEVSVNAGHEKYPDVTAVRRILDDSGRPVQAPMPRKVPEWLASEYNWYGESAIVAGNPAVNLDWKQIPLRHAGLATYKDLG